MAYFTLARDYRLGVRVPGGSSYTSVSGVLMSWSVEAGTFSVALPENNGVIFDAPTTMQLSVMFNGLQEFTASGITTRDAGQQLMIDAFTQLGEGALVEFQITHVDLASGSHSLTGTGYVVLEAAEGEIGDYLPFDGQINLKDRAVATGSHFSHMLGSLV